MTITILLILLLASVATTFAGIGATLIVTKSFLFRGLQRAFDPDYHMGVDAHPYLCRLFTCPQCMGFWVGWLFQIVMLSFLQITVLKVEPIFIWDSITAFFQGCITSWLSLSVYLILKKLGYKTE